MAALGERLLQFHLPGAEAAHAGVHNHEQEDNHDEHGHEDEEVFIWFH